MTNNDAACPRPFDAGRSAMTSSDVPRSEMDAEEFAIKMMAEADDGVMPSTPDHVSVLIRDLLRECAATPVRPNSSLAEVLNVASLPQSPKVAPPAPTTSKKLATGLGAFVATTLGKMVLGTAIAAASVGGAHAADIIDVPGLPDEVVEVVNVEAAEDELAEISEVAAAEEDAVAGLDTVEEGTVEEGTVDEGTVEEGTVEEGTVEESTVDEREDELDEEAATFGDDPSDEETTDSDDAAGDDAADEDDSDDTETATHGSIVSEFATTTELEGCERGQAIAELASSNAADHRQNNDRTNPCGTDAPEDDNAEDDDAADDGADDELAEDDSDDGDNNETATHGSIVSEFATTTELEGCERGQAIAELASSNAADHRQNNDRTNPCGTDTSDDDDPEDAAAGEETSSDAVLVAVEVDEQPDDSELASPEETTAPSENAGRPENAGPPEHAGAPEHAGPPENNGGSDNNGRPDKD